jgi:hypothetical protein
MKRFFFDYTKKDQLLLDYRGNEFHSSHAAIDFAKAIAQDLKHRICDDWNGWSVEVRNVEGQKFFSLPVESAGLQ